jgi:hypothetical protein
MANGEGAEATSHYEHIVGCILQDEYSRTALMSQTSMRRRHFNLGYSFLASRFCSVSCDFL